MYIPGFSLNPPNWFAAAEKSGAVKEMDKDTTIVGYIPYQRARQVAIISGIFAALLFECDGPVKYNFAAISIVATFVSIALKWQFEGDKDAIMRIHNRIIRNTVQSSNQ